MNREELKKHLIGFHKRMLKHGRADYAEQYFHYSDEDMAEEYLKEVDIKDPEMIDKFYELGLDKWAANTEEVELEEGVEMFKIGETDEERAYRRGYMDGYDEGLYDGEYK